MSYCRKCRKSGGCVHTDKMSKYEPNVEIERLSRENEELRRQLDGKKWELARRVEKHDADGKALLKTALELNDWVSQCASGVCSAHRTPDPFCRICNVALLRLDQIIRTEKEDDAIRVALETALRYVLHTGANQTERGEPHPQAILVKMMEDALETGAGRDFIPASSVTGALEAVLRPLKHRSLEDGPCFCFLWPDEEPVETLKKEGHGEPCLNARKIIKQWGADV